MIATEIDSEKQDAAFLQGVRDSMHSALEGIDFGELSA